MENKNHQLQAFLQNNPNANKTAISEGIDLKGLPLFNLLKKMTGDGTIAESGEGDEKTYSLVNVDSETNENETGNPEIQTEAETGTPQEQTANLQTEEVKSTSRDNSKFKFNGQEYGKGPLVRAVVAQHVQDNPGITYKKLKEAFPDDLLKRFGIFQDEETAKTIANKGNRYFTKPEQVIKLKDKSVVVCNQFTLDNIQPFLKTAKALGYKIK